MPDSRCAFRAAPAELARSRGTGTSLEQLVGAYAALARQGLAGRVRYTPDAPVHDRRLLSPGAAWIIRELLAEQGDELRGRSFAPGSRPRVAWKTGTSYGFRDAWAIGVSTLYTVGVWVGRPDGTPLPGQYGAVTALPLLRDVFDSLPQRVRGQSVQTPPAEVRLVGICWPLGIPQADDPPGICQRRYQAWTLAGSLPPTLPDRDARVWSAGRPRLLVDAGTGRRLSPACSHPHRSRELQVARWPALADPWLTAEERRAAAIPPLSPDCAADALAAMTELRIDGPADGSTLAARPAAELVRQLRALGAGACAVAGQWPAARRDVGRTTMDAVLADPASSGLPRSPPGGRWLRVLAGGN